MSTDSAQIDAMLENLQSPHKEICTQLRAMIRSNFPDIEEKWRWSRPIYAVNGKNVCYMVANKNDVNFGFDQGAQINDPKGQLAGTGTGMRHLKIRKLADLDVDYCKTLLTQAIALAEASR